MSRTLSKPIELSADAVERIKGLKDGLEATLKSLSEQRALLDEQVRTANEVFRSEAFAVANADINAAEDDHFELDIEYLELGHVFAKPCSRCQSSGAFRSLGDILSAVLGPALIANLTSDGDDDTKPTVQ